jgi:hypothetical protein
MRGFWFFYIMGCRSTVFGSSYQCTCFTGGFAILNPLFPSLALLWVDATRRPGARGRGFFFEVWELDLRCWGPLRRARAPPATFPTYSTTSDSYSGWFSAAPATVPPRATDCSFFLFFCFWGLICILGLLFRCNSGFFVFLGLYFCWVWVLLGRFG